MSDERFKKNSATEQRGNRSHVDADRGAAEESLMTSQERRRMFRSEWTQEALPTPPAIPGFHLCWLSSTNQYDPIHKRMRMGYTPVKADELPGFESMRVKDGENAGLVACNEMVLYKMPMDIYQDIMQELHHHAPNDEADKIRVQVENIQGARDNNGKRLGAIEGDGFSALDRPAPVPVFG